MTDYVKGWNLQLKMKTIQHGDDNLLFYAYMYKYLTKELTKK